MEAKYCVCENINPSENFEGVGKIDVFMVLNLDAYLDEEKFNSTINKETWSQKFLKFPFHSKKNINSKEETLQQKFVELRNGKAFSEATRHTIPDKYFLADEKDKLTLEQGHDFQVFRRHLIKDWLSPTYILQKEALESINDLTFKELLKQNKLSIRLSRAGFLEVKITKYISIPQQIINVLRELMEMQLQSDETNTDMSPQLRMALFCADRFIEGISHKLILNETEINEQVIFPLRKISENPKSLPYRQRYTSLLFEKIQCNQCHKRVEADSLKNKHWDMLASVLEGVLVKQEDGSFSFPEIDDEIKQSLSDLASWKNDLCLFSPERCLIYFPPVDIFIPGRSNSKSVPYKDYWECILRGIEHTIVIRTALQSIEYYTTSTLESDPRLTEKVVDKEISEQDKEDIRNLARAFSSSYKALPILRDILVPSSSYRASYAINKFEKLNKVLHIQDIREHVERNIDELVSFVQFYSSMELQQELNKSQEAIDRAGFIITIAALFIAAPSFIVDFANIIWVDYLFGFHKHTADLILLITLIVFVLWSYRRLIKKRFRR